MRLNATFDRKRGVLVLQADNEFRSQLAYARRERGWHGAEAEVAEGLHEAYEFVAPEHVPGALTDAPILGDADDVEHPDNGEVIVRPSADVFWFPDYMVADPWALLARRGRVEFVHAGNGADEPQNALAVVPDDLTPYQPGGEKEGHAFYVGERVAPRMAPELFGKDSPNEDRDEATPGLYFWHPRRRRLFGPYGPTFPGADALRGAGGFLPEPDYAERVRPSQLSLSL